MYKITKEIRKKLSDKKKGIMPKNFRLFIMAGANARRGKPAWNTGIKMSKDFKKSCSDGQKRIRTIPPSRKGIKASWETKMKMSKISLQNWSNTEYRKKVLGNREMSKLEIKVLGVIDKYNLPYKFVGNGQFSIERKVPDFINTNGEKKAVEVYSERQKDAFFKGGTNKWKEDRVKIFSEYGWVIIFLEESILTERYILNSLRKEGV